MNQNDENIEVMKDLKSRLDKVLETQDPKLINIQPKDTSKGHFYLSLAKSFVRITAGVCLVLVSTTPEVAFFIKTAGALLIAAEVLGIFEELV